MPLFSLSLIVALFPAFRELRVSFLLEDNLGKDLAEYTISGKGHKPLCINSKAKSAPYLECTNGDIQEP